ncbi:MAG: hypothetical protein ACPGRV_01085, partial [Candidatus Thalassarchaeaceae archaeon]
MTTMVVSCIAPSGHERLLMASAMDAPQMAINTGSKSSHTSASCISFQISDGVRLNSKFQR